MSSRQDAQIKRAASGETARKTAKHFENLTTEQRKEFVRKLREKTNRQLKKSEKLIADLEQLRRKKGGQA